jgi:hypothetical protein
VFFVNMCCDFRNTVGISLEISNDIPTVFQPYSKT